MGSHRSAHSRSPAPEEPPPEAAVPGEGMVDNVRDADQARRDAAQDARPRRMSSHQIEPRPSAQQEQVHKHYQVQRLRSAQPQRHLENL